MPESSERAAAELLQLRREASVSAKTIAAQLGKSESWVSRRLNGHIEIGIDSYNAMRNAISEASTKSKS